MAESPDIKDPAVAIQLARIDEKMEGMRSSNIALGKQLEVVVSELKDIAKIAGMQTGTDASVKRIWEEISLRDKKWDERFSRIDIRQDTIKEAVGRIFWFSSGVSAVAGLLLAVVLWTVNKEMDKTEQHDTRLDRIEIHLAGDQIRPYKAR